MSAGTYALLDVLVPFGFSAIGVWAHRAGGARALGALTIATIALLETLAYRDWQRQPATGTPLAAYVLLASLPILAAAWTIRWASRREMPTLAQWLAAGTAGWAAIFPALLIGGYLLR
ncbi:MAG: hypothetical protein WKG32_11835 [Gemmatimonadaceae bacterium]